MLILRKNFGTVERRRAAVGTVIAATALVVVAAGCGSSKAKVVSTSTSTSTTSSPQASVWKQDAQQYRGQNGKTYTLTCTASGAASTVWGAGTYTDDASICTAAVQSGLITVDKGGTVTYKIAPGQGSYDAGTAHGVTSRSYGTWAGSFTFPDAPPGTVAVAAGPESWSQNASAYRGQNGKRVTVQCAANGTLGSVWGSGPYTDDSSVCTAGVHAGLITAAQGGTVVIEIAPGQPAYTGTTAHGVTTSNYASFGGGFTFPSDQTSS